MFFLFRSFFLSDPRFLFSSRTLLAFSACFTSFFFAVLFAFCWGNFEARFRHACIFSSASSTFCDCVRNLLGLDHQLAIFVHPVLLQHHQPPSHPRMQPVRCPLEMQSHVDLRIHLVDVLPARTAAPGERDGDIVLGHLRGGSVHSPGSGIGRVSATRGPEMPRNISTSFGPLSFSGFSSKSSSSSYCGDGGREEERDVRGVRWTHRLD